MTKKFKYIVEIEIDEVWVADGFHLTNNEEGHCEHVETMINLQLPCAYDHEFSAKVLSAPTDEEIAKAQGFKNVNEFYQATTE